MNIRVLVIGALFALLGAALAQQPVAYTLTNDMAEYTTVHVIDVGDVDGHILRIFELVWDQTENDDPAIFNGVRVQRIVQRAFADYVNSTGSFHGYEEYLMENGDVLYSRYSGTTQTVLNDDGSVGKTSVLAVHDILGGTGAFEGIRGLLRSSLLAVPGPNATFTYSGIVVEGSYWLREEMASE